MEAIIPGKVLTDTPEVWLADSLWISQPSEDDSQNQQSHHPLPTFYKCPEKEQDPECGRL